MSVINLYDKTTPLAQFASFPGELFPELGYEIRERMSAPSRFLFGLANDEIGYIVPVYKYDPETLEPTEERDYRYPWKFWESGDHYEETMSVGPGAAPRIVTSLTTLLERWGREAEVPSEPGSSKGAQR